MNSYSFSDGTSISERKVLKEAAVIQQEINGRRPRLSLRMEARLSDAADAIATARYTDEFLNDGADRRAAFEKVVKVIEVYRAGGLTHIAARGVIGVTR